MLNKTINITFGVSFHIQDNIDYLPIMIKSHVIRLFITEISFSPYLLSKPGNQIKFSLACVEKKYSNIEYLF